MTTFFLSFQELRLMLITELRDAYKEKNKTLDKKEFEFDLESMKNNVSTKPFVYAFKSFIRNVV